MTGLARSPMVLVVLDGWGSSPRREGNAIAALGDASFMARLGREWPSSHLLASGASVGLPDGYMGNSEVGHLCLGAGRVVLQDLARIDRAIADGSFARNVAIDLALRGATRPGAALHLIGLLSDGCVHSHIAHFEAIVDRARAGGVRTLFAHAFLDGRDTPPMAAPAFIGRAEKRLEAAGYGPIATVVGRYYAMDRDNRWERTEKAWRALALREGERASSAAAAVASAHARGVGDEFVPPVIVAPPAGGSVERDAAFRGGDAVVFFNFRADRARPITRASTQEGV